MSQVAATMERAQAAALAGHEAVERDNVLRELWHLLAGEPREPRPPQRLRLVHCDPAGLSLGPK